MKDNNLDINEAEVIANEYLNQGKTVIYIANKEEIIGLITIADTIKPTSKTAIDELNKRGIETIILTGDNKLVAKEIGRQIGIDKVIANVLPQDKEKEISNLQNEGKKVAFVGDGINDSPALVKADVGLAIGSGTDIAIESADIILIKNDLIDVVKAIALSKAVIKNIKINLFWAFFYNAIGIPIAAGVFYSSFGLKLSPMIGAAAMSLSSVCVVTNALRLRGFKSKINIKEENKVERNTKTIYIEGMQCNHCKMSVEKALQSIEGITNVDVSLEEKRATIEFNKEIDDNKIKEVITDIGFTVKDIK